MLTEATYSDLAAFFKFMKISKTLPLTYSDRQLKKSSSWLDYWCIVWQLWCAMRSVYTFTCIISTTWSTENVSSFSETLLELIYAVHYGACFAIALSTFIQRKQLVLLYDGLFRMDKNLQRFLCKGQVGQKPSWIERCMKLIGPGVFACTMLFNALFPLRYDSRIYYYSHLQPPLSNVWTMWLYFILESYGTHCANSYISFNYYTVLLFGTNSSFWLEKIREMSVKRSMNIHRKTLKVYRHIQILTCAFNDAYRSALLIILNCYSFWLQVMPVYILVKHRSDVDTMYFAASLATMITVFLYEIISFPVLSGVSIQSNRFLARNQVGRARAY